MTNQPTLAGVSDRGVSGTKVPPAEGEAGAQSALGGAGRLKRGSLVPPMPAMPVLPSRMRRRQPPTDPYDRLAALVGALDGATAQMQEAQRADEIFDLVGTALRTFGIGCQVALLDNPIESSGEAAVAAMSANTLRIAYVSLLPTVRRTVEGLIERQIARFPIPLAQVEVFTDVVRTHRPVHLSDTSAVAGEALKWLAAPLRRRLLRLIHASTSIIAPLLSRGRVLGIMGMWAEDLRSGDAAVLGAFARQTGIALDNTRLFQQLEQGRSLLQTVMHTNPSGIAVVTGSHNQVRLANPQLSALSPRHDLDPVGRPLDELFPPATIGVDDRHTGGLGPVLARVRRTRQATTVRGMRLARYGEDEADARFVAVHVAPIAVPELERPETTDELADAPLLLIVWDTTEAEQAEVRLRTQVRRSEALAQAALALEREHDLPALLARIGRAARDLTDADWAGFLLRTKPDEPFTLAGVVGTSADQATTLRHYVVDLPVLLPLLTEGTPLLLADVAKSTLGPQARLFARAHVRSLAGTALMAGGGWIAGVLVVGHHQPARFTSEHAGLLSALGAQAAAAIERAWALESAYQRADELEATFRSINAGVAIYDLQGNLRQMNEEGRRIARYHAEIGQSVTSRHERFNWRLPDGSPLPEEQMPSLVALKGEPFYGAEYLVDGESGPDTRISVSGAALRGTDNVVRGSVVSFRNITSLYQLEHRTQEALDALLDMAAMLVASPPDVPEDLEDDLAPDGQASTTMTGRLHAMLHDLCVLAVGVLGCKRVLVDLIDPETQHDFPVAIVGLTPEEQQAWETALLEGGVYVPNPHLGWLAQPERDQVLAGQTAELDFHLPRYRDLPNPIAVEMALAAPMRIDNRTVGVLVLDFGAASPGVKAHRFSSREKELAITVARLAALAVERHRMTEMLAEMEALRRANELKEQFLSIASHELKTPLTVLQARTQATERQLQRLGQTEAAAQFAPVRSSLMRLNALVNELLVSSQIVTGNLKTHPEVLNLGPLVSAAVGEAREVSARTIVLEGADAPGLDVLADAERLPQVLTNLLDNALKYSRHNTPVMVRVWRAPASKLGPARRAGRAPSPPPHDEVIVSVSDEGVGIHPDDVEHVFERFYRARTSSVREYGGLGLGLHIVATFIKRQGGRIWAESPGPGLGSTFGFALPAYDSADGARA